MKRRTHTQRQSWCDCHHRRLNGPYPNVAIDGQGRWHQYCATCGHCGIVHQTDVFPMALVCSQEGLGELMQGFYLCDCKGAILNPATKGSTTWTECDR